MSAIARLGARQIFFLGVNTGYVDDGLPDARFLDFYLRRSSPELHCAIVGNVVVPGGYGSNAVSPRLTSDTVWGEVAAGISEGGSRPGIQLATAWDGYVGSRSFVGASPSQVIAAARELTSQFTREDLMRILDAFDNAADCAIGHGYKHIQVHAAHGYLLSLLVDLRLNTDAEFVLDRLARLGARLARDGVESSIRISMKTGHTPFDVVESAQFYSAVCSMPFDYIDLSSGFYNIDKRLIYPARPEILAARQADSLGVAREYPATRFIVSGHALRDDWSTLPANMHVGVCRDLIANPNILKDLSNGCQNHNKCHYYSRGEDRLTCARWMAEAAD